MIEANAAPGDAFSNACVCISITFKGVIGLLSKSLSDSCAETGSVGTWKVWTVCCVSLSVGKCRQEEKNSRTSG